ncbi:MAG: histidine--tRNA ligase [Ardenticatenaceae bacterium]|nr:histidine--tRNA ligase [Anaerolineales bacterium]MCB8920982.1 histidine--tRNA ligase [Ardenticatenaceae bacterium]MCB8991594.1 histidine--tRNA ligase [Ardenticatenaceae bacterium]MCB9004223.1 histidine--tRNA ligase [Ardenticatenaceae bacterium]
MTAIQRPKGMQDVLPDDRRYWDWIIETGTAVAQQYGFQRLDVPIIEFTPLFARGMGEASDVFVQKEMYTIEEDDGESITLRPEFTAGLVRAYIENGLTNWPQPVKLFSIGPIFRRERPQAGRYRQHSQFDVEIMGETDPAADLEVMMIAMNLYRNLGYKGLTFQLNSTGCPVCKPVYIAKLKEYLADHLDKLAAIDQERMIRNPLRVLDSKEPGMDELLANAPHIVDHLCADCESHFANLRGLLDALEQSYTINFRLVRGIDYYTKTVFEVWAEGIGAQAAVCGGGRYDGLAEAIGGPSTPGVGFGSGIERIVLGLQEQGIEPPDTPQPQVLLAHFGGATKTAAVKLTYLLRDAGIGARLAFARERRSMKSQMREANKYAIRFVLILGESEVEKGVVTIRPLDGGEQVEILQTELITWLNEQLTMNN